MVAFKKLYEEQIVPELIKSRGYTNKMQVPRLQKIVINMGVGVPGDRDELKAVTADLARITGQQPVPTIAKTSVSNFRLREGMAIGCKVTLRGARMYEFMHRLVHVALPRIRDFRGVSPKGFDKQGNYTLGLSEQTIFPEINPDNVKRVQGMDISFVTTAQSKEEGHELIKLFGMPFAK
ncbi:MAG: 50S ribosomal protein L5 [Verrucomicrobia bacterium]|nr:50S ribosomal protein L5 [Verrucomicrobiota bacterium]MCH8510502.1 50S ribosomal protein L5 [Kiritimatiellia bacterium]